jgi:hypothetical protein
VLYSSICIAFVEILLPSFLIKRNIMSTTPFNAAQVIIPKQQDNSIAAAAAAMITINQNTNKD